MPENEKIFAVQEFIRKIYKDENFILDQIHNQKAFELIKNISITGKNNKF